MLLLAPTATYVPMQTQATASVEGFPTRKHNWLTNESIAKICASESVDIKLWSTGYVDIPRPTELLEIGTLDLAARPAVIFKHGLEPSNSTEAARAYFTAGQFDTCCYGTEFSITIHDKNAYVIIPTIFDHLLHSPEEARTRYAETGEHMGKFNLTPLGFEQSESYAQLLHVRPQ